MVLLEKIYLMLIVNVGDNKCNCTLANVSFIGLLGNYPENKLCNPVDSCMLHLHHTLPCSTTQSYDKSEAALQCACA